MWAHRFDDDGDDLFHGISHGRKIALFNQWVMTLRHWYSVVITGIKIITLTTRFFYFFISFTRHRLLYIFRRTMDMTLFGRKEDKVTAFSLQIDNGKFSYLRREWSTYLQWCVCVFTLECTHRKTTVNGNLRKNEGIESSRVWKEMKGRNRELKNFNIFRDRNEIIITLRARTIDMRNIRNFFGNLYELP